LKEGIATREAQLRFVSRKRRPPAAMNGENMRRRNSSDMREIQL